MEKKKVLVVYGGESPEHEVAVITALQVMNALVGAGYQVLPLYITKSGNWRLGDEKFLKIETYKEPSRMDTLGKEAILSPEKDGLLMTKGWFGFSPCNDQPEVVFPVIHGKGGEDGTLQGLFELANIPFVGCGVTASAIKIDKYLAKRVAGSLGIKVLNDLLVVKGEKNNLSKVKFPAFVKPVGLGSSIGLKKVKNRQELNEAIEVAFCYDTRVMIEEAMEKPKEVNISIIGNGPYKLSVTEQPVASGEVLSFEDKYVSEGKKTKGMASAQRLIPATVGEKIIKEVEESARKFFREIGGKGMARIDFMVNKNNEVYFNEINTMPGSLAFYLWEKTNLSFPDLVDELVVLAVAEWREQNRLVKTFENNILASVGSIGLKR